MDYTYFAQDLLNKNINELELFSKLYLCTYGGHVFISTSFV